MGDVRFDVTAHVWLVELLLDTAECLCYPHMAACRSAVEFVQQDL